MWDTAHPWNFTILLTMVKTILQIPSILPGCIVSDNVMCRDSTLTALIVD